MESAHPSEMLSLTQVSHITSRDLIPAKPQLSYKESSESITDILHVKNWGVLGYWHGVGIA